MSAFGGWCYVRFAATRDVRTPPTTSWLVPDLTNRDRREANTNERLG